MKFAGIIKQSLVDYPGKIATVLFTWGCNFRCPFCHNRHLVYKIGQNEGSIPMEQVESFLEERKGFIDAVVISGGEPTLESELADVCRRIKESGYLIKLDTNGTRQLILEQLLAEKLLDYVAMDIKAPLEYREYLRVSGRLSREDFLNIRSSIHLLQKADIKAEFRTTVVPSLHKIDDITRIAMYIKDAELYSIQQFRPLNTLDPALEKEIPYSKEELQQMAENCKPYVKKVQVLNL